MSPPVARPLGALEDAPLDWLATDWGRALATGDREPQRVGDSSEGQGLASCRRPQVHAFDPERARVHEADKPQRWQEQAAGVRWGEDALDKVAPSEDGLRMTLSRRLSREGKRLLTPGVHETKEQDYDRKWRALVDGHGTDWDLGVELRKDGGLDGNVLLRVWRGRTPPPLRYLSAVYTLSMTVFNFYLTARLDLLIIMSSRPLVGFQLLDAVQADKAVRLASGPAGIAMLVELLLLAYLVGQVLWNICRAACLCEKICWRCISKLVFRLVPRLTTASAMRFLQYVHPTVLGNDFFSEVEFMQEDWEARKLKAVWRLVWFMLSRILVLWLGLEVFLVKFRATAILVNQPTVTWQNSAAAAVFLFQVMGIVNLNVISQMRLNQFVFAGSDCVETAKELVVERLYYALLAKRLWDIGKAGCSAEPSELRLTRVHAVIVMLSFTDKDFQELMVKERETSARNLRRNQSLSSEMTIGLRPSSSSAPGVADHRANGGDTTTQV